MSVCAYPKIDKSVMRCQTIIRYLKHSCSITAHNNIILIEPIHLYVYRKRWMITDGSFQSRRGEHNTILRLTPDGSEFD